MGTLGYSDASQRAMLDEVLRREREFHDAWAKVIDRDGIHVPDYFEACTAPENRFILRHLGDGAKYILVWSVVPVKTVFISLCGMPNV